MRLVISLLFTLFLVFSVHSQSINPALLENASSVVLENNISLSTTRNGGHEIEVMTKTLILNKKSKRDATIVIPYDKFSKADFSYGLIKNLKGEIIKKIKAKDLLDQSAVSGFSLYEDNRMLIFEYEPLTYPVVIEYAYKISTKHNFYTRLFSPIQRYGQSVIKAKFVLSSSQEEAFIYKTFGVGEPEIEQEEKSLKYTWTFDTIPALLREPFTVDINSQRKAIMIAPVDFTFEGYAGSNADWVSLGNWIYQLQEGRLALPETAKADVKTIVDRFENPYDQAKAIYEYMQERSRYVSIQLGIGGFQPFDAQTVHALGYGDCKALTNYTQALMQEAGLKSYYTLVKAGKKAYDFEPDFTANQFNHVILCAVIEEDTVWMECTSQQIPFGFLGDFTDNRPALLIKKDGSTLIKTPHYNSTHNKSQTSTKIILETNGNAKLAIMRQHHGLHYDDLSHYTNLETKAIQKKLGDGSGWKNYTISNIQISEEKSRNPEILFLYDVEILGLGTIAGNRIFVPISPISTYDASVPKLRSRKSDFALYDASNYQDTLVISPPESYHLENPPERILLESDFGSYSREVLDKDTAITIIRQFVIKEGKWDAVRYSDFYDFREKVNRYDQQKLVFKRE